MPGNDSATGTVHFCFGMSPDFGGRPFSFCHYLAVRSAWEGLQPRQMVMHYVHEPSGLWWDLARSMLVLHKLPTIEGIHGFPVDHPAHRADIVRLVALLVMGGVYLDTDVLVLRPFDSIAHPGFAAALEVTAAGEVIGLSNAILLAQPSSRFARLCLEGHDPARSLWQGFRSRGRDHLYVEMSVRYPAMLAGLCPGLLEVLPTATFLSTDWRPASLAALFEDQAEVPPEAMALHLWESHAWQPYLAMLTPESVRTGESTFARLARPFLPEAPGRPVPAQVPSLSSVHIQQMEALYREVNHVHPWHSPVSHRRLSRKLASSVRRLRDAWQAPLRSGIQQQQACGSAEQPTPPTAGDEQNPHLWARCGRSDGSWELIRPHLPASDWSALLISGPEGEPSACAAVASHPGSSCLWVSDSLPRAARLAAWIHSQGIDGRAIHHPHDDPRLIPHLVAQQFTEVPALLVIGPTARLETLLQGLAASDLRPGLVLIAVNPAVERLQHGLGPARLHPRLASQVQGPGTGAVAQPLQAMGYRELTCSSDGQFLLLQLASSSNTVQGEKSGRLIPPLLLRSLYGDPVTL